jgi:histidinol-phosphatase (PHP family)
VSIADKFISCKRSLHLRLIPRHTAYLQEALRLREKYQKEIKIIIGFEGEWIRRQYGSTNKTLDYDTAVDFFIGSVHHVHGVPIDYNAEICNQAIQLSGGTTQGIYADY